jgi:dynein light intermediate chain 1, cytosolic
MEPKLNPGTPSGEGVLANFFNSLLHKKSGSPGGPNSLTGTPNTPRANGTDSLTNNMSMRMDAAAELDRLSKKDLDLTPSSEC